MTVTTLGEQVRIYNEFNRLIVGYVFIEARENLEFGQLLTWKKNKFKASPSDKRQTIRGVAIRSMDKGERDLVKFYGESKVNVAK